MDNEIKRTDDFVRTISTDRFNRYLKLAGDDKTRALDLYACNTCLSQSLYIPLQALEITLRNSIHECLRENVEEYWFDKKEKLESDKKKTLRSGKIIAELSFGFWTGMFTNPYENLWRKSLYKIIIPERNKRISRKSFSKPLTFIRKLRNRIAHHECIIEWDLKKHYLEIKVFLDLLSPEVKRWMERYSTFDDVYAKQKTLLNYMHKKKSDKKGS